MNQAKEKWGSFWGFLKTHHIYLVIFFLELIGLDLVFRYAYRLYSHVGFVDSLLFTFCWAVLLTAIAWLLPGLVKKLFMALATLLYGVLALVHCGMFSFFGRYFSFSDVKFAGDGAEFFQLSYIHIRLMMIGAVLLCVCGTVVAILLVPEEQYRKPRVIVGLVLCVLSVAGINLVRADVMKGSTMIIWDATQQKNAIYDGFTDNAASLKVAGLYQYTFRDFNLSFGVYDLLHSDRETLEALDAYYAAKETDPDNEMTGLFAGKNLILVQLEAIDTWLVNDVCMPTLYNLKENGIDFVNHYAPAYITAGTFNTESIVNIGFISPFNGGASTIYSKNTYPYSVANLFRAKGYSAHSFHNSGPETYNRGVVHLNWGYESYTSGLDMGMDYIDLDSQLIRGYEQMTPDAPFFTFIITISGHGPYEGSLISEQYYDKFAALLPEGTRKEIIHAYAHAYETDIFISELMERLEADGLLEDTVLVFYADHYDYYVLNDALIMQIKEVPNIYMAQHTPFFIYQKDTAPRKISKVTGTIDILPTLANLFDLDTDGRYYVGNDAFSENGGYVMFQNYSWFDGELNWNPSDPADSEHVRKINEEMQERFSISWDTLNTDYFAKSEVFK